MSRMLRLPEVKDRVGMSTTRIYQQMRDGTFPRSRRLGRGSVGWLESDLDDWMRNLPFADPAESRKPPAPRPRAKPPEGAEGEEAPPLAAD